MPEPPRGVVDLARKPESGHAGLKDCLTLWHTPSYILDTLGMTAMTFALGGIAFWMPRYIIRVRGLEVGLTASSTADQIADVSAEVNMRFGVIVVVAGLIATLLGGVTGDKLRG